MLNVSIYQFPALREFVQMGKPVWGTCAGLIFLADKASGGLFLSSLFCLCCILDNYEIRYYSLILLLTQHLKIV